MIIHLDEQYFNLAKTVDYSELRDSIVFNEKNNSIELKDEEIVLKDYYNNEYKEIPVWAMLDCISDEIALTGLSEDQETVLPRGEELCALYDSIYYSIPEDSE